MEVNNNYESINDERNKGEVNEKNPRIKEIRLLLIVYPPVKGNLRIRMKVSLIDVARERLTKQDDQQ